MLLNFPQLAIKLRILRPKYVLFSNIVLLIPIVLFHKGTLPLKTSFILAFEILIDLGQELLEADELLLRIVVHELELLQLGHHLSMQTLELLLLHKARSINILDGLENPIKESHTSNVVFLKQDILKNINFAFVYTQLLFESYKYLAVKICLGD